MKEPTEGTNWFFVDESGDPTFYDAHGNLIVGQEGCSPILISQRGTRLCQGRLEQAVMRGVTNFEKRWNKKVKTKIQIFSHTAVGEPCLQVIDYMNWAVHRAFVKRKCATFSLCRLKSACLLTATTAPNIQRTGTAVPTRSI